VFLGVLKVHMSEFGYTSEQETAIMRHVRIHGIHLFSPFLPFSPGNHHSRSLEGKYTFLGGIWWVLGQGARISDFRSNLGVLGEFLN